MPDLIRTPDQRLRVFLSSTLQELRPERFAAKAAVQRLHLSPVMFELGARPHPPRELYRAYLEQSHIFVGIYWERYGWVAPGEAISGLEDEYRLSGDRPKLVYVKSPAPAREERLIELLQAIQDDDKVSYKPFETADELQQLVADDLAILLTERFEASAEEEEDAAVQAAAERPRWPRPPTALIGRTRELAEVRALLDRPDVGLVTLLGPGGIGKSRLAVALGADLPEGSACFVELDALADPALVLATIAETVGAPQTEGQTRLESLVSALDAQPDLKLLVLDNFEQVSAAAADIGDLLAACRRVELVVTSRTPLRLAAEHEYPVGSLRAPAAGASVTDLEAFDAVRLFLSQARAVRPSFGLTEENAAEVAELTRRLDGLPLALELAAARAKFLSPAEILARLDRRFDLLSGGERDAPDRQQTLKRTIDWSFDLLQPAERRTLAELSVFAGGWSLHAAEAVADPGRTGALLEHLAGLVDDNLVIAYDTGDESRFGMLESIRAYAQDKLGRGVRAKAARQRHAAFFLELAEQARTQLNGPHQRSWLNRLETELDNIRAALTWFEAEPDDDGLGRLSTALALFWWVRGHYAEGRGWLAKGLARLPVGNPLRGRALDGLGVLAWVQGDYVEARQRYAESLELAKTSGDELHQATALGNLAIMAIELDDLETAQNQLAEALAINRRRGNLSNLAANLINLSLVMVRRGDLGAARDNLEEAVGYNRQLQDSWGVTTGLINLAGIHCEEGRIEEGLHAYVEALGLADGNGDKESIAYSLEGFAIVAQLRHDGMAAARFAGAAAALRQAIGNPRPPGSGGAGYEEHLAAARAEAGGAGYDEAFAAGRSMPLAEVVAAALAQT